MTMKPTVSAEMIDAGRKMLNAWLNRQEDDDADEVDVSAIYLVMQASSPPTICSGDAVAPVAKIVHDAMVHAVREFRGDPQPWQNGNSTAESYARQCAKEIVALSTLANQSEPEADDSLNDIAYEQGYRGGGMYEGTAQSEPVVEPSSTASKPDQSAPSTPQYGCDQHRVYRADAIPNDCWECADQSAPLVGDVEREDDPKADARQDFNEVFDKHVPAIRAALSPRGDDGLKARRVVKSLLDALTLVKVGDKPISQLDWALGEAMKEARALLNRQAD